MLYDNQIVILKQSLPLEHLEAGAIGTVVNDFANFCQDSPLSYLVEFADKDGITLALVTLQEEDLEPVE